jgi:hypothetical protein
MAIADVKAFYQRLANDQVFSEQIQSVDSKEECSQKVREAGFSFTQEEFEEYTSQLLETDDSELRDLNERELEVVFGGASSLVGKFTFTVRPMYGVVVRNIPWPQPTI